MTSELKFFELKELGEVPVTPLVRQVLIDAGYVLDRAKPQQAEVEQFKLIPILVAGASEQMVPESRFQRPRRSPARRRGVCNSGLLFDTGFQT